MTTVGVMGGMGPLATVDFMRRVVGATTGSRRDQDHIHMVVDHDPAVPDRTSAIRGEGPDPTPSLVANAQRLEAAGADLLVMPCNTAHLFAGAIARSVGIPLVNWPHVVAHRLAECGFETIGLVATDGTVASGIYQHAFASGRLELLLPTRPDQERIMRTICAFKADGPDSSGEAVETIRAVGDLLAVTGADCILLGCTDLSALVGDGSELAGGAVPYLDASQLVAAAVVANVRPGAPVELVRSTR